MQIARKFLRIDLHGDILMIQPKIIDALQTVFPELSKKQLEVTTLYAHGATYESIAEICHISVETVRSHLKRSTKAMKLEGNDALRSVILIRSYHLMISLMITK
ncbi:sigma factor-like helix-turn-helix DNA-binding protein [Enterobacter sp. SECR19-1250]|uniref:helix-turn-helix transcriptional regulator n=1 Tax=Enterobacter sp. SECR19-1250 TaxID=2749084 RepID=UPI0021161A70|nr:sigma factor-like helix-turn-helix DNA-binding protein [Enterobacter sp. SECR19-1250]